MLFKNCTDFQEEVSTEKDLGVLTDSELYFKNYIMCTVRLKLQIRFLA